MITVLLLFIRIEMAAAWPTPADASSANRSFCFFAICADVMGGGMAGLLRGFLIFRCSIGNFLARTKTGFPLFCAGVGLGVGYRGGHEGGWLSFWSGFFCRFL